jgi:pilus assembly protein CpaF
MTVDAYEVIRRRTLDRIDSAGIDPEADPDGLQRLVAGAVQEYQQNAHLGEGRSLADPAATVDRLLRSVSAHGHLSDLLARSDIEEIFIEGDRVTYLEASGRLAALDMPTTELENRQVLERMLAATDRRLDASTPIVQARILNGAARLTAIIPPVSDHVSATIRRYALRRESLESLVELGSLTLAASNFLTLAMRASASTIVSGPPGAGKTSFLSALMAAVPADHCIRSGEEVRELHVPILHGAYYEARPPSLDGSGEISLRDLVKMILAMRPDLIVVGEVRGAEAFELTRAVNAGCGMAATIHANSAVDALKALVNSALMAGENVPDRVVRNIFASSIDLVVHLDRDVDRDGVVRRETMEIRSLVPSLHDDFSTQPLFERAAPGSALHWSGAMPPDHLTQRIERLLPQGTSLADALQGREVRL